METFLCVHSPIPVSAVITVENGGSVLCCSCPGCCRNCCFVSPLQHFIGIGVLSQEMAGESRGKWVVNQTRSRGKFTERYRRQFLDISRNANSSVITFAVGKRLGNSVELLFMLDICAFAFGRAAMARLAPEASASSLYLLFV